ncbi:MAG: hypothetical protein BWY82_01406 [Verrucomicrobia bacterium ADurb.Bin474]|nr:MAG: hypothetical protein BWY82_01406 [Verrucomicrobia bacterium ADurb.Bin474]
MRRSATRQAITHFADILLRGQKHKQITRSGLLQDIRHRIAGRLDVGIASIRSIFKGPVSHLHWKHPATDFDDRSAAKSFRKPGRIDGRGSDHNLQIRPFVTDLDEMTEDEIDVDATFVGFVDDQSRISPEHGIPLHLVEQDPIRHNLDSGLTIGFIRKSNPAAHPFSRHRPQLFR